jgi:hypothetical protein
MKTQYRVVEDVKSNHEKERFVPQRKVGNGDWESLLLDIGTRVTEERAVRVVRDWQNKK